MRADSRNTKQAKQLTLLSEDIYFIDKYCAIVQRNTKCIIFMDIQKNWKRGKSK